MSCMPTVFNDIARSPAEASFPERVQQLQQQRKRSGSTRMFAGSLVATSRSQLNLGASASEKSYLNASAHALCSPELRRPHAWCTDGARTPSGDGRSSDDWEMLGQPSPDHHGSPPDLHRPSLEIAFDADLQTLAQSNLKGKPLIRHLPCQCCP